MKNQRSKFSLPSGGTYLNCAYMSPLSKVVEKAGMEGMRRKRNPAAISAEDFFTMSEVLRKEFARLINVDDANRIVIIPSASYGLATAARNLKLQPGDKAILAHEQFPSNYYAWLRLTRDAKARLETVLPPDTRQDRGKKWNERILEAIVPGTKIIAIGHVHWADGTKFDLERIGLRAREVGAKLIIDGTQSVGALPFDVKKFKPDALICAGYKWLMGPYSIGLAYFAESFDGGIPLEENWINRLGSEDFAGLIKYQDQYQPGALRYEVGEHSNFILVPMMLAALRQINAWGPDRVQEYCRQITAKGIRKLTDRGFWVEDEAFRGCHMFGIRFPESLSVSSIREEVRRKKISVSFRGDSMRVSPHVYNEARDMDRLVDILLN